MENEMIERVAKALYEDGVDRSSFPWPEPCGGKPYWLSHARAAIEAMREPSEAMADAGQHAAEMLCYAENGCEECEPTASPGFQASNTIWAAMIDNALLPSTHRE